MNWKGLIQRPLGKLGYQIHGMPCEGTLEREVQRVLADREISTVLDVGAHVGVYGDMLRRIGFTGRIVSFEPASGPFLRLAARCDESWEAFRIALGNENGEAVLHLFDQHEEFASLRAPSDFGRSLYDLTVARTERVRVRRLDDVVADLHIEMSRTMVKLDTQGHDLAVIKGGLEALSRAAALQVEIPMFGIYEDSPSGTAMIEQLKGMGFELVGLFAVHAHPRPLVPVEFDGLFARGAAIG